MTKEERHLWYDFLKGYSPSFRRQYVILEYIVDFFCPAARLAIELDGSQHYEPETASKDRLRSERIEEYGIEIVRYTNLDIQKRFDEVCEDIDERVKHRIYYLNKSSRSN